MPSLHELQSAFVEAVFAARSTTPCRGLTPRTKCCFEVYRNNTFANFTEALRAVYPAIERLVGDEFFAHAARRFVRDKPSTSGDLHRFGANFAEFLAALPACRDLAYLPDTARLEWLMHEAFHAADHPPLNLGRLAAVPPERYDALRFCLHPACRLLTSPYPVHRIWQVNQSDTAETATVDLAEGGVHLLIARPATTVEIELVTPAEFAALAALSRGDPLGDSFEYARRQDSGFDAGQFLRRRVSAHTLVDFQLGSPVTQI